MTRGDECFVQPPPSLAFVCQDFHIHFFCVYVPHLRAYKVYNSDMRTSGEGNARPDTFFLFQFDTLDRDT